MAARYRTGVVLERVERFDVLLREIEEKFSLYHSLLDRQRGDLVERVEKMRELSQEHRDLGKAIEQLEVVRKATSDVLTENLTAVKKEEGMKMWDERISELKKKKTDLEPVSDFKFVTTDLEEFSKCVRLIYLRETEAIRYSKREAPLVMRGKRGRDKGEVYLPRSICIDGITNEVFVVDRWQKVIFIYSEEGEFIRSFGRNELRSPYGICITKEFVFVTDVGFNGVVKFLKTGGFVNSTNSQGGKVLNINFPTNMCAHNGYVYVCNTKSHSVEILNEELLFVMRFEKNLKYPEDIKIFNNQIFVLTETDRKVHIFSTEHTFLDSITLIGHKISHSFYFAVDKRGNFIISDEFKNCLKVFNPFGEYITTLGEGFLFFPQGVAIDNKQRIIVLSESDSKYFQVY